MYVSICGIGEEQQLRVVVKTQRVHRMIGCLEETVDVERCVEEISGVDTRSAEPRTDTVQVRWPNK